jgi:predicted metal-dependent RNase
VPRRPAMASIECLVLGTRRPPPLAPQGTDANRANVSGWMDAGAGQDVGKSCVVATIGGRRVMFDCGVHLSYKGRCSYPEFDRVLDASGATDFTVAISCVVITHS